MEEACVRRKKECFEFLKGLYRPDSPVYSLGPYIVRHIIDIRCESTIVDYDFQRCWFDIDHVNRLHRGKDEPAVIWANGSKHWYINGEYHREGDEPAIIWADGTREWYKNGLRHRDGDKPAVIEADGTKEWYKNGQKYKDNYGIRCYLSNNDW